MAKDFGGNQADEVSRRHADAPAPPADPRILRLPRVDSTNREAERLIASGVPREPFVVIANEQTAGEGRRGVTWWSPPGGLWATMAWPLAERSEAVSAGLGVRLGLACLRTVRTVAPAASLKWPNDVLLEGRKVCGCMGRLVTGPGGCRWILAAAGINANNEVEAALSDRAASLGAVTRREIDLEPLEARLLDELSWALTTHGIQPAMVDEANAALAGIGRPIRLRDRAEIIEGELLGLGRAGTPRVRLPGGRVVEVGIAAETVHDG